MKPSHLILRNIAVGMACLLLTLACGQISAPANAETPVDTPSEIPSEEPTAKPSDTPRPTSTTGPTDTPQPPPCYKWDEITLDMAGDIVCVYGVAYSQQGQSRIDFSPEKNSFFLIDPVYYYPELGDGVCVVAEEEVEVFDGTIPFMTIRGGLYKCEPWMLR